MQKFSSRRRGAGIKNGVDATRNHVERADPEAARREAASDNYVSVPALPSRHDTAGLTQMSSVVQRKRDHLFNDIPKTMAKIPRAFLRPELQTVTDKLIALRDNIRNSCDDVHDGEDENAAKFGWMNNSFLIAVELYGKGHISERGLREATYGLWKCSIDNAVAEKLGGRDAEIDAWNKLEREAWKALDRHS